MATFKIVVQKKRKDGFYTVYIRLTHNRRICYIKTDKLVNEKGLVAGTKEIKDTFVLNSLMSIINEWITRLNHVDTSSWTLEEVKNYVEMSNQDISFSKFAREYINTLYDTLVPNTVYSYELALSNLEKYAESDNVMFCQLTVKFVEGWIRSLNKSRAAKFSYPTLIRKIFKEGIKQYNDYDNNIVYIQNNPWIKVKIPKIDRADKRAITMEECRVFFALEPKNEKAQMTIDICKMMLCLAGINVVDLYYMQKSSFFDGILHYERRKTKGRREDHAYIEMKVPDMLIPTFERYKTEEDDPYLFNFHKNRTVGGLNSLMHNYLKMICKDQLALPEGVHYTPYTFRHTWATIAQNDVGANYEEIGFAMNHVSAHKVTMGYVKPDFSRAWELNEGVVEKVFFTNEKSKRLSRNKITSFDKIDDKVELEAEAFYMGEVVAKCEGKGYVDAEEIIAQLMANLDSSVPVKCTIQIKVVNKTKKQTKFFERQR